MPLLKALRAAEQSLAFAAGATREGVHSFLRHGQVSVAGWAAQCEIKASPGAKGEQLRANDSQLACSAARTRVAHVIGGIYAGATVEQQPHDVHMAPPRGQNQRSHAILRCRAVSSLACIIARQPPAHQSALRRTPTQQTTSPGHARPAAAWARLPYANATALRRRTQSDSRDRQGPRWRHGRAAAARCPRGRVLTRLAAQSRQTAMPSSHLTRVHHCMPTLRTPDHASPIKPPSRQPRPATLNPAPPGAGRLMQAPQHFGVARRLAHVTGGIYAGPSVEQHPHDVHIAARRSENHHRVSLLRKDATSAMRAPPLIGSRHTRPQCPGQPPSRTACPSTPEPLQPGPGCPMHGRQQRG